MTNKGDDFIRKRLLAAGSSNDDYEKYVRILRQFLAAQTTKVRFETEMLKILPRGRISVHNDIIREILRRAQSKREGVPDLPVVTSAVERPVSRPVRDVKAPAVHSGSAQRVDDRSVNSRKRPRELLEDAKSETRNAATVAISNASRVAESVPGNSARRPAQRPGAKASAEQARSTSARPVVPTPRLTPQEQAIARSTDNTAVVSSEPSTYSHLSFFPVRPGQAMDLELFLKLRQRMRKQAVDEFSLSGVRDDAVALLLHGLEAHVKSLMEAGVRQRTSRQAMRPHRSIQCGPVLSHDFREAALRNVDVLGDEAALDLERLVMLLH